MRFGDKLELLDALPAVGVADLIYQAMGTIAGLWNGAQQ